MAASGPPGLATAQKAAATTGEPVAVAAATTPTESTIANPDGTFTTTLSATPVRTKRGGAWIDLKATLVQHGDGTYGPAASSSLLSLSGGGTKTLATMVNGGQQLTIDWPTVLPTPLVSANRATYPAVMPGVDMQVTASEQGGFSHVLVVHDATAAKNSDLSQLQLTTRTSTGLTLAADQGGNLSATDRRGRALFTAPAPMMWDSTTAATIAGPRSKAALVGSEDVSSVDGPGAAARSAEVGISVAGPNLTLTPANALLHDPAARFPIYIDPSWNANSTKSSQNAWTYVSEAFPNQAYLNSDFNDGIARAGYNGWSSPYGRARSFFQFKIPSVIWKTHVLTARLQITEVWSSSTKATTMKLFHTGTISKSTTWNRQPTNGALITSRSVEPAHSASEHPQIDFDVASEMRIASDLRRNTTTIAMQNSNETNRDYWRKFKHNPVIAITYNAVPNKPTNPTISPSVPCAGGLVGLTEVTLSAILSDPDGTQTQVEGDFTLRDDTTKTILGTSKVTVSNRKWAPVKYAAERFLDGHTYSWTVMAFDGKDRSLATAPCHFTVDHTQPAPPTVTDSIIDDVAGRTPITFQFVQPVQSDVPKGREVAKSYVYALNVRPPATIPVSDGPFKGGTLVPAAATGTTDRTITPTRIGTNTLYVYAIDVAKNPSPVTAHTFTTTGLTKPDSAGDFTGDGTADFIGVGSSTRPGLWLHPGTDRKGHVTTIASNVGAAGVGDGDSAAPTDWNGASVSAADLDADGVQDVLARMPADNGEGNVVSLSGTGDGSILDPATATTIRLPRIDGEPGGQLVDQIVAEPAEPAALPDLYAVVGDDLYRYSDSVLPGVYGSPEPISPGWAGHTIAATRSGTNAVIIDRNDRTGRLDAWTLIPATDDATAPVAVPTSIALNGFERATVSMLSAADIDTDGEADMWAVAKNGDLRAYLPIFGTPLVSPVINPIGFPAPS